MSTKEYPSRTGRRLNIFDRSMDVLYKCIVSDCKEMTTGFYCKRCRKQFKIDQIQRLGKEQ